MTDEPEYLKALRRSQERRRSGGRSGTARDQGSALSPAEQEALRWAREVAGQEVRAGGSFQGARYAMLAQPKTYDGKAPMVLDGFPSMEALIARYEAATSYGDTILGCYEVPSARPLTVASEGGKTVFTPGQARRVAKPLSPEQMIRRAAQAAEQQAKKGGGRSDNRRPGGR
ncbi:MAG: hypothetical protein AB7Q69_02100 [Gemmatimonadales bacterium]